MLLDTRNQEQFLVSYPMSDIFENKIDDSFWQEKGREGRGVTYGGKKGK